MSYTELGALQEKYSNRGFSVLAFPTNDFHQEFEDNDEIQRFVTDNFHVTFPVFGTAPLKENPVYQQLQRQVPYDTVKHNFFKYLVNREGVAVALYSKKRDPLSLADAIEELLDQPSGDTPHHQVTD